MTKYSSCSVLDSSTEEAFCSARYTHVLVHGTHTCLCEVHTHVCARYTHVLVQGTHTCLCKVLTRACARYSHVLVLGTHTCACAKVCVHLCKSKQSSYDISTHEIQRRNKQPVTYQMKVSPTYWKFHLPFESFTYLLKVSPTYWNIHLFIKNITLKISPTYWRFHLPIESFIYLLKVSPTYWNFHLLIRRLQEAQPLEHPCPPCLKLYIRNPGIKSCRLVYAWDPSEEGGGGGWLRGGSTFWDTPSRIFLGHFYRIIKTP